MHLLSKEQQSFVQAVLVNALMRAHQRQKSGKDASGDKLTRKDRSELKRYINELEQVLLAFDMSTPKLDDIAKQFG